MVEAARFYGVSLKCTRPLGRVYIRPALLEEVGRCWLAKGRWKGRKEGGAWLVTTQGPFPPRLTLLSFAFFPCPDTNDYGYAPPQKKKRNKWLWIGIPILLVIILAAVLGGVLGSRAANNNDAATQNGAASGGKSSSKSGSATATDPGSAAASSVAAKGGVRLADATDTYLLPVYPTTVRSLPLAAFADMTIR